ncbi:MAG: class I SAM-dependent methyltransferase [Candidatus Methanoperedens sp.]|nr:class I SAM-dependent methyltransferase [Candidatus Methanoperedens sp.]MCZ7395863.1 class I SAM-dependent methyltransferase [Candidatus Methanoperedens sp.]
MAHKFDVKSAEILDSPERILFLNPDGILDKAGLSREMVLADLGCGTGYFTIPASRRVKKVFAIDVQKGMLDIVLQKIKKQNLTNIEAILSEETRIPLPDNSVDVLLMANVFHELEDRSSILKEGKRILSGNGIVVIVDWKKLEMDFGPPVEERLTPEDVISICRDNGFEVREQLDAGPYNYLLIFGKMGKTPGKKKIIEEMSGDKYFHGERKQYSDIDDLIKKTLEDRKQRRLKELGK